VILILTGLVSTRGTGLNQVMAKRKDAVRLALAAIIGAFCGLVLLSIGTKYSKAGISSALSSTYPIWIIPFARVYLGEKGNWQSILCTVVAVGGIALMFV
jgi:drug/metabolite transporter (DMT)-like permease